MTTEDDRPIDEHSPRTASASCAPTGCCASPPADGRSPPRVPAWVSPNPNEVLTDGSSIAPTQNAPTSVAVTVPAPRSLALRLSHAAAHTASRISPGITTGTSRRLAHGWSGTVNGCHRTAAEPPRIDGERQRPVQPGARVVLTGQQRPQAPADQDRRAEPAEQHGRDPRVPDHPVQGVLGVQPGRIHAQSGHPLQGADIAGLPCAPACRGSSAGKAGRRASRSPRSRPGWPAQAASAAGDAPPRPPRSGAHAARASVAAPPRQAAPVRRRLRPITLQRPCERPGRPLREQVPGGDAVPGARQTFPGRTQLPTARLATSRMPATAMPGTRYASADRLSRLARPRARPPSRAEHHLGRQRRGGAGRQIAPAERAQPRDEPPGASGRPLLGPPGEHVGGLEQARTCRRRYPNRGRGRRRRACGHVIAGNLARRCRISLVRRGHGPHGLGPHGLGRHGLGRHGRHGLGRRRHGRRRHGRRGRGHRLRTRARTGPATVSASITRLSPPNNRTCTAVSLKASRLV